MRLSRPLSLVVASLLAACASSSSNEPSAPDGSAPANDAAAPVDAADAAPTPPRDAAAADAALPEDASADADGGASGDDWYVTPAALAPRPPMGWNSWNAFHCNVSEALIKSTADAIIASGMKSAGYAYVNIDDCWQTSRAADGTIVPDATAFPNGIKGLADYVHGQGLKLGVYSDRGTATCAGRPGAQGYEAIDAKTYAAWGVDYLKEDNCNASLDMQTQYEAMHAALTSTGSPIVLSICAWKFQEFMPAVGQLWRTTDDIQQAWGGPPGILANLDVNANLAAYAHPGAWNDPDMLEVGNSGITDEEARSHFALWAIMAAPLIAGNDVRAMSAATKDTLTNSEIVAIDQDALGYQGVRVRDDGDTEVWTKPLQGGGARAVVLFNRGAASAKIHVSWAEIGLADGIAAVRDLWAHNDLGDPTDGFDADVASHATAVLRVNGDEPALPSGKVALTDLRWTYAASGFGPVEKDKSNGEANAGDGRGLSIGGHAYARGLGVHGGSAVRYRLGAKCTRFTADVGLDDEVGTNGSVRFQVWADGAKIYDGLPMKGGAQAAHVDVDVTGRRELKLVVTNAEDGPDFDHADWGEPTLDCAP